MDNAEISGWIRALGSTAQRKREQAESALEQAGTDALPALAEALTQEGWGRRATTILQLLSRLGPPAAAALPAMFSWLQSNPRAAAKELVRLVVVPLGQPVLEPLVGLLRHGDAFVRSSAVEMLGELGPCALVATDELERLAVASDPITRVRIAEALRRIRGSASSGPDLAP